MAAGTGGFLSLDYRDFNLLSSYVVNVYLLTGEIYNSSLILSGFWSIINWALPLVYSAVFNSPIISFSELLSYEPAVTDWRVKFNESLLMPILSFWD